MIKDPVSDIEVFVYCATDFFIFDVVCFESRLSESHGSKIEVWNRESQEAKRQVQEVKTGIHAQERDKETKRNVTATSLRI